MDEKIERIKRCEYLTESEVRELCEKVKEILADEANVQPVKTPVTICGDIHGQYYDLLHIFETGGWPPSCNYLFLGDYVDRGVQSIEVVLLLFCLKMKFPRNFFLLRGNHETPRTNKIHGFYLECQKRHSTALWRQFNEAFQHLPIAAVLGGKMFCVHGGISPVLNTLDQIAALSPRYNIPDSGLLCDLLWSDPQAGLSTRFRDSDRGVSYCFSAEAALDFLRTNGLDVLVRAHQVEQDGFKIQFKRRVMTIFSAPNYCRGEYDNSGTMLNVSADMVLSLQLVRPASVGQQVWAERVTSGRWTPVTSRPDENPALESSFPITDQL
eukprot:gnl/Dysnectes_brevis/625_a692_2771.p1 GENE.gnl/Dysnectes_brevis/625_a692_2771~~gnl/Dysnectes_brevis/625_a692_2771.p1  ORF type:complete len:325 (-),score=64.23 gnl/Dysnectes_brevis/625_a692_2771:116-1090(-)